MSDIQPSSPDRRNERGVVLLIVLIMMVFVAILATDIVKSARYDYSGAVYMKNELRSAILLDSASRTALDLFVDSSPNSNSSAYQEFIDNFNSTFVRASTVISSGELSGRIEDESGKLPLSMQGTNATIMENVMTNLIVRLCREHGFASGGLEENVRNYIGSIRCWTGRGNSCADDDEFYGSADPAYSRPKKNISTPDELLLVKRPEGWLSDEEFFSLYYGTGDIPGLKDLVTPFSQGTLNINSVPKEVIMAFVPLNRSEDELMNFYDDVMKEKLDTNGNGPWFKTIRNRYAYYRNTIPEVKYKSDSSRVTIDFNNGIYHTSIMVVFDVINNKPRVRYKKIGYRN